MLASSLPLWLEVAQLAWMLVFCLLVTRELGGLRDTWERLRGHAHPAPTSAPQTPLRRAVTLGSFALLLVLSAVIAAALGLRLIARVAAG